ncbi:MAG: hypothetical protein WCH99_02520 [Verrucomicrobiota bacterium]
MNIEEPNPTPAKPPRRILRRVLISVGVLAMLLALFYAEENWRGQRAWENCKRELEAKGVVLDWNKFIPPSVPDDQNLFKAPRMDEWFQRNAPKITRTPTRFVPGDNELRGLSTNVLTSAVITNEIVAANYLSWSDQFGPQFDLIREALKRPYARMDGDYSQPFDAPIPNFLQTRSLALALVQRSKCYLLIGQPEKALRELTLLNDSRKLLERAPTGKPMFLVDAKQCSSQALMIV